MECGGTGKTRGALKWLSENKVTAESSSPLAAITKKTLGAQEFLNTIHVVHSADTLQTIAKMNLRDIDIITGSPEYQPFKRPK